MNEIDLVYKTQKKFGFCTPLCQIISILFNTINVWLYLLQRAWYYAEYKGFVVLLVSEAIIFSLKLYFQRSRPYHKSKKIENNDKLVLDFDKSLPSSHAMYGFCIGMHFGCPRLMAFILAWSRVVLGVHHWSDTLSGLYIAALVNTFVSLFL